MTDAVKTVSLKCILGRMTLKDGFNVDNAVEADDNAAAAENMIIMLS